MAKMIGYLIHSFPLFSSTFVNDEVDEMRKQGAELALFAVQRPRSQEYPPSFERFYRETTYVFPIRYSLFFGRHLQAILQRPRAYFTCLAWILTKFDLGFKNRLRTLFHFAEAIYLYPEIRSRGCQHLHVHFLLGGASIAVFLNRIYGLSYSLTAHGSDIFVDRVLQKEKLEYARFTRLATEYNANFLRPLLSESKRASLHIIPFGIDQNKIPSKNQTVATFPESITGTLASQEKHLSKPLRLLAVGRLIWQKAQHLLLEACAELDRRGLDFHLRLIGEGPLRSALEEQIRSLKLENKITMVGAMPSDAVWQEYMNADLFILSSISEGSPFVIMEAMGCGLPVIAPALHGIPEMIRDGVDGRLFKTGSAEALTKAMAELFENASLRKSLGFSAEISVKEKFDQSQSVSSFYQLLKPYMEKSNKASMQAIKLGQI